jgi:hypothetical protein
MMTTSNRMRWAGYVAGMEEVSWKTWIARIQF